MKSLKTVLNRTALLAALPAALAFSGCGSNDPDPAPVTPDQGKINIFHAAASANVPVKGLIDDADKGTLSYGQSSGYQAVNTGNRTIKVNVASSGTTVLTQGLTVEKDKNYSYFAYATTLTDVAGLLLNDDLTAPSSGKAKIRLVHLGQGAATPVKLSTTVAGVADIAGTEVAFGKASGFVEILPGSYNVAVTTGATSTTVPDGNVGDGSGAGTVANKTYEAGKIYTVVYRGVTSNLIDNSLKPRVALIQNN